MPKTGTKTPCPGASNGNARLTERTVLAMRRMFESDGLCIKCIAKLFDATPTTTSRAVHRKTWKNLP